MKLSILKSGEFYKAEPWWYNFRKSIDPKAWPGEELSKTYNAKISTVPGEPAHIVFETDEDALAFLLKWG